MDTSFALSPLQQGMLVQSIDKQTANCYVVQTVFAWDEPILPAAFEAAWTELAGRHEVLRSSYRWKDTAVPLQIVAPTVALVFEHRDLGLGSETDRDAAIQAFLDTDLKRGFGLSDAPPWRITLLAFNGALTAVWTFHHLLLDGRSHILLLRELLAIYDGLPPEAQAEGRPRLAQRHYAQWMEAQDFSGAESFWKSYLAGAHLPTPLPPMYSSRPHNAHSSHTARLGPELTRDLQLFSAQSGISIGNIVQASWGFVLGWLANETDVVTGSVRACRRSSLENGEHLIGIMINTLPLRLRWQRDSSILSILGQVAKDWKDFRHYEHTPLTKIRQWSSLGAGVELFSSAISFSSAQFSHAVTQCERRRFWLRQTTPYCSVDVGLLHEDAEIQLSLPGHLLEPDLARDLPGFLRNTIRAVVQDASQPVAHLSPLDAADRQRLISTSHPRREPPPRAVTWINQISAHARSHPEQTAITSGEQSVSWREFDQSVNQLAALLLARGMQPGNLVAVFLPRSPEFVWTCLAILKAGGAYLPMDAKWPAQRILNVLTDAQPFATITNPDVAGRLPEEGGPYWLPEQTQSMAPLPPIPLAPQCLDPDSLAYVIYTSGSSGVPKGVEVTHVGLQNLVDDMVESFSLEAQDRGSFLSNTSFDASVHEVWPLLSVAASVHIPSPQFLADPAALLHWVEDQRITFSFMSVIMAEAICRLARGRSLALRYLLTGGDQLRVAFSENLCFQLINEYGPTEYSVVATRYPVTRSFGAGDSVPIGQPARGTRAYVMNGRQQLLPWGVAGELVLAGNGIARGYRNQPTLTAEKFTTHRLPEEPSPTLYRTGDLVRWLPDGNLQFQGRIDFQVKLRGFRIELGEIEACLLAHPQVAEAVVIFKTEPAPALVAFAVSRQGAPASLEAELSAYLGTLLPEYMVPAKFVFCDQLPTSSSGKYDRKQLAAMPVSWTSAASSVTATFASPTEKKMAEIWQDVLNIPAVQPSDRFLSLGGTSLSIIRLICAIDQQFGAELPAAEVFRNPTPAELARLLDSTATARSNPLVPLKGQGSQSPLFCIPGAAGGIHWFRDLAAAIQADRPVIGVELLAFSEETQRDFSVDRAAEEIANLIEAFDRHRECSLCGFSGGGLLAIEAALKLEARGIRVRNLFLLETYPPAGSTSTLAKARRWVQGWWSLPPRKRRLAITSQLSWLSQALGVSPGTAGAAPPEELPRQLLGLKQRHIEAFVRHSVSCYRGQVDLFFAEDRPLSVSAPAYRDWSAFLVGSVAETMLPGDHYSLLRKENVGPLAHCLMGLLAKPVLPPVPEVPAARNPQEISVSR